MTGVDFQRFHDDIRRAGQPVVLRGLVDDWPVVAAARGGDRAIVDYLIREQSGQPVTALIGDPAEQGRFFYNRDVSGFNFARGTGQFDVFMARLLQAATEASPPALAIQSERVDTLLPAIAAANRLALLPDVAPRIWIGNRIRVAAHYDLMENVACVVAGRRRFTLFPPEQVGNLYPGPFELTPAGTPISMVDFADPDLDTHPRFVDAWSAASTAELEPGDALYIPYLWWHAVESLEPVSILINYWWSDAPPGIAGPYDALLHAMFAYRHLPPNQRAPWKAMLDHYVFEENGDPGAHLPPNARGVLATASPELFAQMRSIMRSIFKSR